MNIGQQFVEVDACILPAPSLQYKERTQPMNTGSLGAWNLRQVPHTQCNVMPLFVLCYIGVAAVVISRRHSCMMHATASGHACKQIKRLSSSAVVSAAGLQQACEDSILGRRVVHRTSVH